MDTAPLQTQRGYELLNIHCSSCNAPATYDIVRHTYACSYCGNETGVGEAKKQRKGFRALRRQQLRNHLDDFVAVSCTCTGCGAEVVFPENEVLQSCSFCGRALVRDTYLKTPEFPELIIPFRLTPDEARDRLRAWCDHNPGKREARHLRSCLGEMQGYYLPYELIRGPIDCHVSREGSKRSFTCGGFLNSVFVNTSAQLHNLTLNGMEPFDLNELQEFEFGYLAQQKAKVDEIDAKTLDARVKEEVAASYRRVVEKTLETRNLDITPHSENLMRMPLLLPVYYISTGNVRAAVNGQTGKVAVCSETVRKTMPWWVRPIAATLALFAAALAIATLIMGSWGEALIVAAALTLVMGLVFYTAFSNAYEGRARQTLDPEIFTSKEVFERGPDGLLRASGKPITEDPVEPVFFEDVDGVVTPVSIRFTTATRMLKMALVALAVAVLPILVAFVANGFGFHGLHPEGAAVWLLMLVPIAIAYFVKIGRIDIYENPYVYAFDEHGGKRRIKTGSRTDALRDTLRAVFSPPLVWLALAMVLVLVMSVYLTLGG